MTGRKHMAIAALGLPLIAASDSGPPSTGTFFITVFVILGFFLILRNFLPTKSDAPSDRGSSRLVDLSAEPQKPLPLQTPEELEARLERIRQQATNAPSLVTAPVAPTPMAPPPVASVSIPPQTDTVLFRQHLPPRAAALSYWGGVPLVPVGFTWPSGPADDGTQRALHHIVQIDCAAIPEAARLGLPDHGLLQFFVHLDWGRDWGCHVVHSTGDPTTFAPASIPDTLPNAYGDRAIYQWVRRDEDWPRLLPRWSFDPVLVRGGGRPPPADEDEEEESRFWPGTIDLAGELAGIDGAIAESAYFQNRYGEDGRLVRPFANFPHDWQAVRIALGELAYQAKRNHMARFAQRGDMTQEAADAYQAGLSTAIDDWTARANAADPLAPLTPADSDAVWQVFLDYQHVTLFALTEAVNQSIEATLSSNPDALRVLPDEAFTLVRGRHALGSKTEHGLHINTPDHLLGPPSYVQGAADERLHEWILLFEMSSDDPIGHHFAEGVLQFWIRPEDLAAHRFDRVELEGSAY